MWIGPVKGGLDVNHRSFMLSPKNNIESPTKPSALGSSIDSSFDVGCFSFNGEEGSGYYAMIGPDG
jgi:hypothetical protein